MTIGETVVRYFLTKCDSNEDDKCYNGCCAACECCDEPHIDDEPVLIAQIRYPMDSNFPLIVPRFGEQVVLEDIFVEGINQEDEYNYYVVEDVLYCFGPNHDNLIDVMVTGRNW